MNKLVCEFESIAQSTIVLMSRIKKSDATYLLQSDVISIRIDLNDLSDEFSQPGLNSTGALTPPTVRTPVDESGNPITDGSAYDTPLAVNVVFNTLQTDARWTADSTGYNVSYKLATPLTDHEYEMRMTFTLSNGDVLVTVYQITSR